IVAAGRNDGGVGEIDGATTQIQPTPAWRIGRRSRVTGPRARDHAHPAGKRAGSHPRRPEFSLDFYGTPIVPPPYAIHFSHSSCVVRRATLDCYLKTRVMAW